MVIFSASASYVSPILCLITSGATERISSGITKALFCKNANAFAAIAKLILALGEQPKSIIGCNLSHINTWTKIINEPGKYFLILEDDVRFKKDWINTWNMCAKHIPEDADILYLGGVLPPNKVVLSRCTEQVNDYWCQITDNTIFTATPLPVFHFCAYSYIISKKGAEKLLQFLTNSDLKSYTVSDHLLGSPLVGLKKYFTNPLLSYCFQEEDPVYLNSQFNDLHRKDTFDSDIWNNTECFTEDDLKPFNSNVFYYIDKCEPYEQLWLDEIFGKVYFMPLNEIQHNAWFLVQRPIEKYNTYFKMLDSKGIHFKVLHLSDEFCTDDISFYSLPSCRLVISNYIRSCVSSNVYTIPLGFHYKSTNNKSFEDRKFIWSFHGTDWFNRKEQLEFLSEFLHNCHLTPDWNHSTMTKEYKYLLVLGDSKFCPILRGNNVETFRMYECLESGTIPLYVRSEGDELYWKFISRLSLLNIETWEKAKEVITYFLTNPEKAETYRKILYANWNAWKSDCMEIRL